MPAPTPRSTRRQRARPGDDGGASVELVLAAPVLVLLLMLVVQFAVGAHASHIAQAAANAGAQAGRLYHATNGDAQTAATTLLAQSAGTILANPVVSVTRTATTITVTVTGTASTVVPGLTVPIRASVTAPVERATSMAADASATRATL